MISMERKEFVFLNPVEKQCLLDKFASLKRNDFDKARDALSQNNQFIVKPIQTGFFDLEMIVIDDGVEYPFSSLEELLKQKPIINGKQYEVT